MQAESVSVGTNRLWTISVVIRVQRSKGSRHSAEQLSDCSRNNLNHNHLHGGHLEFDAR